MGRGLPVPAGVLLARWASRTGGCTPRTRTGGWPCCFSPTLVSFALFVFGARAGLTRLAERVYASAAVLAGGSVSHDWPVLYDDIVGGQVPGERVQSARPYEAQIAAAWRDGRRSDQRSCVHARAVHVELLVTEPECDPAVRVIGDLRSHDVPVKADRAIPVADGDHHVVEANMFQHSSSLAEI
jgi:hypothetical protein